MASIVERNGRWRALVRMAGNTRCATFSTRLQASRWAKQVEGELEQLRASGVMDAKGQTLGDLIDRYIEEFQPRKKWGRSKSADLARLKRDIGHVAADKLTSYLIVAYFEGRARKGSGGVVISAQAGYLVGVLKVARTVWHLDVPLKAAEDARASLAQVGSLAKSRRRDRRVTDVELAALLRYFERRKGRIPMADLTRFAVASGMRISEVCRLTWRDLNEAAKTIVVRDRKHPRDKYGNDQVVPLLNATGFDAFEIVMRQPPQGPRIFPYSARTVSSFFTRAAAKLGIEDLRLHDLRHEAVSRLFEAGYRIEQVALVSGHRDWAMLRRYTHVKATDLHKALPK